MTPTQRQDRHAESQTEIWDPALPFPDPEWMEEPGAVTHVMVERAEKGGYHYLHESAIAWHRGRLYVGFANHRLWERNIEDEVLRGRVSSDGVTFGPPQVWVAPPATGASAFNHPVIATQDGRLWGFFTRWEKDVELPRTEIFRLNDASQKWEPTGHHIPSFIPFTPPLRTRQGNWVMGGESFWFESAVAISRGDDWTSWDLVVLPRPEQLQFHFPETTLLDLDDRLVAFCRPRQHGLALVSSSTDGGRTWTPLTESNFPITSAKPLAGTLSTRQRFLITNHIAENRSLLTIALTEPGGQTFKKMLKLRHQAFPRRRVFGGYYIKEMNLKSADEIKSCVGEPTEWSYPAAVEHEGKLYISHTRGKEDCVMSIVPVSALEVTR